MSDEYKWEMDTTAGIKIELPAAWVKKPPQADLPNGLLYQAPDSSVGIEMVFVTKGPPEVQADEKRMMDGLQKKFTDVQVTKPPSMGQNNGLKVFAVAGTAKLKGIPVNWYSLAFGDGKGHGLLALIVASPAGAQHADEVARIYNSVQLVKPPDA
jgi:hypothetical protein